MKFKVKNYSNERLKRELEEANSRLRGYLLSRETMPDSSILGSLAIAAGIKYEQSLIAALKEELEALKKFKKEIEDKQRKDARDGVINQMAHDFPELTDCEDYKKLLENEELTAEDLENKAYAIVGKLEREKRGNKRKPQVPQSNRVPLTSPTNKDKKTNSPYGGLLIK